MKRFLENDLKILSLPIAIMLGIILMTFVSGKIIIDNISRLNQEVSDNKKNESILKSKLSSLQTFNQLPENNSQVAVDALPGTAAVLTTINELQFQALPLNITLENIKSANVADVPGSQLRATQIDFDANGSYADLSRFIKIFKNIIPITRFDSIKLKSQDLTTSFSYRLSVTMIAYWAPLPSTIPSIGEPLVELSADEQKILTQISSIPQLTTLISNSSSSATIGRADPFSF